ncbi:hypothetical protein MRB53_040526 [Persea americana]|nr:hypothetical protein MRB53_040526 [Persea americana]
MEPDPTYVDAPVAFDPTYGQWPPEMFYQPDTYALDNPYMSTLMQPPNEYQYNYVNQHICQRSSFNIGAEEYVPIAQAIVKPTPESKAVPIVRPVEADSHGCRDDLGYDAYDGFDSGSEDSLHESVRAEPEVPLSTTEDTPNEERVKSFRFPCAASAPATPCRPRTDLFDSVSPDERKHSKASLLVLRLQE